MPFALIDKKRPGSTNIGLKKTVIRHINDFVKSTCGLDHIIRDK